MPYIRSGLVQEHTHHTEIGRKTGQLCLRWWKESGYRTSHVSSITQTSPCKTSVWHEQFIWKIQIFVNCVAI